ncbi:hypothetical protein [Mucilaginibacter sp. UR6-11]|uniref:hypothetical protein n=1 Tax=Mucilaginibacter sp. UR6-11 TaxID=1435644 RepID=UPI001E2DDADF|nr:hypothetical protein [Mucilaginibacter sp. UR6-11]MCC8425413.1 hypothetical protein [Mucilaginibacter sp. UR6-11]
MTVDVNYWLVGLLFLAIVILIRWLIRRDRKDEKDFERTIIDGEVKSEKHIENKDPDTTP